ncbi:hypothetical protein PAECIP111802_03338 [Paenibacillus allorhizosphaerae]|uniref:HTH arsR-type domain-containing protein n=2 Tax=Paenibacillus allorhizosphaerae TaxID=2849866 RepID=A0ABN7TKX1_9BACL|nr:hypothetical protein PAECIP111802_03338 [Paenibacillus allorhizosphaerae]
MSENDRLRDLFAAVADPTRRRLIRLLAEADEIPLHELTAQFKMGRTAVSKHLTILKEAGLVIDRKVGREPRFRLNASPLKEFQVWVSSYNKFWSKGMLGLKLLLEDEEKKSETLIMDFQYNTSIEKVWSALTDSNKLAKWVMENDFKPEVGHRFQFRTQPVEGWNGIIDCEVLTLDAPNRLSYTWVSGGQNNTVTWTLQDLGNGKVNLHFEQSGITNEYVLENAKHGWAAMCGSLEKVLAE